MKYNRVLLKLSGESLAGKDDLLFLISRLYVMQMKPIVDSKRCRGCNCDWWRNIFRGSEVMENALDKVQGDYMGMLATVINGLALQSALENMEISTRFCG